MIRQFLNFFFNVTATTKSYTLSLHDALPIFPHYRLYRLRLHGGLAARRLAAADHDAALDAADRSSPDRPDGDRKSTRLNSSHMSISYAVFCLKKKKITETYDNITSQYRRSAI